MKELLMLQDAVVWCFFGAVGATGFLCGIFFRTMLGRLRGRKREKTVYLAVQEGTVPLDGLIMDAADAGSGTGKG